MFIIIEMLFWTFNSSKNTETIVMMLNIQFIKYNFIELFNVIVMMFHNITFLKVN